MLTVKRVLKETVHYYECDNVIHQLKNKENTYAGVLLSTEDEFSSSVHFSTGIIYVMNDHGKTIDVIRL